MTPEEKKQKKARDNLKILHNQVLSSFNFGQIKLWYDLYRKLGYDDRHIKETFPNNQEKITYPQAKDYLQKQKDELESRLKGEQPSQVITPPVQSLGVVNTILQAQGEEQISTKEAQLTLVPEPPKEEEKHDADDDYGLVPSPHESINYYWYQKKAIAEAIKKITAEKKPGILLLAPTGSGKTPMTYGIMHRLLDMQWHEGRTFSHIPYLVLTKSTIVTQHWRSAKGFFNLTEADCEITNIETLRASAGQLWIKEEVRIVDGEEEVRYVWKPRINPCVLFLDESQGAKNKEAKQSQCIFAYNDLPPEKACLICISATPFGRVSEAKAFAVSTRREISHLGFPPGTRLSNDTWAAYSSIISSPSPPHEYNSEAVERLMKDLEDFIVRVKGVRPQFDADNGIEIIQFETPEKRKYYMETEARLEKEVALINAAKERGDKQTEICLLVVLLRFAMAAELMHAENFAKQMYEDVQDGYAAVSAIKFKQTLIKIVMILNEKYGVSRDKISLIWGGGQTKLTKKQEAKQKIKAMADKFKAMGISVEEMLSDTGLDEIEDRVLIDLPEHLRLGQQSQDDRQVEIDNFQSGKTLYCMYTLKAGGVGLSLPHSDELTKFKCRRKKSGYVVEEDIPKVPVRPRRTNVTITYNAIELVQAVGRVPRINSLSPTRQRMRAYAGTVEVDMVHVCQKKFKCLSAVVKQREDWQDIVLSSNRKQKVDEHLKRTENAKQDESSIPDEGAEGDEGEEGNGK